MEGLTYVTGNYGKYISVKEHFEKVNINIDYFKLDLEELNINDIELISLDKAKQAYQKFKKPVFVADSGFYISNYPNNPGFPGAFVKRSQISSNIDALLENMKDIKNRHCYFLDCLTFYDGVEFYQFKGISEGTLSYQKKGKDTKKAKSNLWYIFIPKNCKKTLAEMSDYERSNRNDDHISATQEFINWYKGTYLEKNKKRMLKSYEK